ncbi:ABC transporter permease [Swingsia samuiensis]|uniref:ABC transporter permease n=2 Tax=Swingsia samuiensis TaxID=1293412 RepID=A0A4Y6UK45_9PROT|nr:ABC transporter permease [Swingsia samuiensis]QDH17963.1 ABC transporter permease [Swingsia samuiensis]
MSLAVIAGLSFAAPLYAYCVGVDPFSSNVAGVVIRHGLQMDIMQPNNNPLHLGLTPIGPDFSKWSYMFGADSQGRDVAARLLYGGRSSLVIAACSTCVCLCFASVLGVCAGYFEGWVDQIVSRFLDILWAIPVYLFAISLSVVTVGHPLSLLGYKVGADSFLIPIVIIGFIYVPYAARPLRAQTLSVNKAEFVIAARGVGASHVRIICREIVPNVMPTLLVMAPLIAALCLLAESALSFLSLGVQAPAASWGTMIQDGEGLLYTRPFVAIAPGIAIVVTVLALNIIGDRLRDFFEMRGARG